MGIGLFFLTGCAEFALSGSNVHDSADSETSLLFPKDDSSVIYEDPVATWFVMRGSFDTTSPATSALVMDVVGDDAATVLCSINLDVSGLVEGVVPDAQVSRWWEGPLAGAGCATLPGTLGFGLGQVTDDVQAGLGAVGESDLALYVYGAYLRTDVRPDEVDVFGYAGREDNMDGTSATVLPPEDGVYEVVPLYLALLPENGS